MADLASLGASVSQIAMFGTVGSPAATPDRTARACTCIRYAVLELHARRALGVVRDKKQPLFWEGAMNG